MQKFKVEIIETQKYIVDVLAKSEANAIKSATAKFKKIQAQGIAHYHEDGDRELAPGTVYDVTHTDDPFNP